MIQTLDNILENAVNMTVFMETPIVDKSNKLKALRDTVTFKLSDGTLISIKEGFIWDEASIPWILQWAFPKSGIYAFSSLLHDALYYSVYKSQKFADKEFELWMKSFNIKKWQRLFRYYAVRLFGFIYYRKNLNNPSERCLNNRKCIIIHKP